MENFEAQLHRILMAKRYGMDLDAMHAKMIGEGVQEDVFFFLWVASNQVSEGA
jgi:hypothetical protein